MSPGQSQNGAHNSRDVLDDASELPEDEEPLEQLYKRGWLDTAEDREEYRPGGFHPIHIGEHIGNNDRYRVVHKLGQGGGATVWLCRDSEAEKYVALKIIQASLSKDSAELKWLQHHKDLDFSQAGGETVALPLGHFWIDGPNGRHLCLVLPVLGPRIPVIWYKMSDPLKVAKGIILQVTQGLNFLHKNGICHGDFRPGNILLRLSGIDDLSEEDLAKMLGEPRREVCLTISGEVPGPSAPKYLIEPLDLRNLNPRHFTNQACIVDFGETCELENPPESLGIPSAYCPPELIFDSLTGVACDIWALACTIFELRSMSQLFESFFGDDDDVIRQMVIYLGKLPEPWWSSWESRDIWFNEDGTLIPRSPVINTATGEFYPNLDTIEKRLGAGVHFGITGSDEKFDVVVPPEECKVLAGLLLEMLKYDPQSRPTVVRVLEHPWFKM